MSKTCTEMQRTCAESSEELYISFISKSGTLKPCLGEQFRSNKAEQDTGGFAGTCTHMRRRLETGSKVCGVVWNP